MIYLDEESIFNELKKFIEDTYYSLVTLKFVFIDNNTINNNESIPTLFNIVFTKKKQSTLSSYDKNDFFYISFMFNDLLDLYKLLGIDNTIYSIEHSIDTILNEMNYKITEYKNIKEE